MWSTVEIGHRQAEVFLPATGSANKAILYLHGFAEERLSLNPCYTSLFEEHEFAVVAPSGGKSWWLDVHCSGFEETTAFQYLCGPVADWIQTEWKLQPSQVGLLGVSVGGQGALNLSYRSALQFPVVAALAPAIDFHVVHGMGFGVEDLFADAEAARQETAILHLHPLNWPKHQFFACDPLDTHWFEGCQRLASKLNSSGIPFTSDLTTSAGGHGWDYFNAMAPRCIQFLDQALKQLAERA